MHPNPAKLLRSSPSVNLLVKEIGDRFIVEGNMCPRASLSDKLYVLDKQQVVAGCNAKSADLSVTIVTQEQ